MAAPTYSTNLTLIDDAQDVANFVATGGGGASIGDETDYFINDTQCVSKSGFTATQKGLMADNVSAPTITAGDAVFIWGRQANRNILDTVANQGGTVIMGTSNSVFAGFNVDGSDVEGSNLKSWVNYAVDPTQTNSYTSGSPGAASTWDHFGMEWAILGSGSLKGSPNAVGIIRYGREIRCVDGQAADYATFAGAGAFDGGITRRWGILTPISGGLEFHGAFVMGQSGTSVDFRDSNQNILVLDDTFVPVAFNEFIIVNASSNVEWAAINITAIGTTSPFILTLDVGTFTGVSCTFTGAATTTPASTSTFTTCQWVSSGQVIGSGATITGGAVKSSTANSALLVDTNTEMASITGVSFEDNNSAPTTAASIELTATGAYTFTDITFTGGGGTPGPNLIESSGSATADVYNNSGGFITINISGGDSPSVRNAAGSTTNVVSTVSVTFDKMRDDTEVRVYDNGTGVEIDGIEDATSGTADNRSFTWSSTPSTVVDYVIHHFSGVAPFYKTIRVNEFIVPASNTTININQLINRNVT